SRIRLRNFPCSWLIDCAASEVMGQARALYGLIIRVKSRIITIKNKNVSALEDAQAVAIPTDDALSELKIMTL
ncbi:MAG: hypothetical protein OSB73_12045, partial [Candidatus Latescibacteria bacterium]|nr:hypothetical protein [Candidatus Latescibacterota bacterium]